MSDELVITKEQAEAWITESRERQDDAAIRARAMERRQLSGTIGEYLAIIGGSDDRILRAEILDPLCGSGTIAVKLYVDPIHLSDHAVIEHHAVTALPLTLRVQSITTEPA